MRCVRVSRMRGQSTVEAAFMLPMLFALMLLLLQPGILLYDRMVMQAAATEGCRLLATASSESGVDAERCQAYVRHRLGSIPPVDIFHVHSAGCSWAIDLQGDETADQVAVSISTQVKPLPLIGVAAALLGMGNGQGNFEVSVHATQPTQPAWVATVSEGRTPSAWVGAWLG